MSPVASPRPAERGAAAEGWAPWATKVQPWHQERLAIVYVRQSTPQQVLDHRESTRLQYGLAARARELGWAADRVVVVDDDLGKSGASAAGRAGFQRLVSEVGLGNVGLVLGIEMSRLARSGADWHRLLELCALFGTLLADADGVYDPALYNDRLLLGLKGTLSEAELHLLKQRMRQGVLSKAGRGELALALPSGYVRLSAGVVALDPDEQVQHVVRLVFRKFDELGTLNAVLRYLVRHQIQIGVRVREGPGKGELSWHRPNRNLLQGMLKNPAYAGAYAYGRRPIDPRRQQSGRPHTGRVTTGPDGWRVLLPDRLPAYITWDQYEANRARLRANQARAEEVGAPRNGAALLAGLAVCGRCGRRMTMHYGEDGRRHTYVCIRQLTDYGAPPCQQLAGRCLDAFVRAAVLAALRPAALELSLAAAAHLERERDDLARLWAQRLERAAYEAERAARRYRLVEPENRLVARQLEREWEAALAAQQRLAEEHRRVLGQQPRGLAADERDAIGRLAADIPALWDAPTTSVAERKEMLRQVVERVVVAAEGDSERVRVTVEWAGGARTRGEIVRPVGRLEQLSYYPALRERVGILAAAGLSTAEIAARLNAEGFRPPKRRATFRAEGVRDLLRRLGLRHPRAEARAPTPPPALGAHEWWLADLARAVGMPPVTLYDWVGRGWVRARQHAQPPGRWILWADDAEVERLRQRARRPHGYYTRRLWVDDDRPNGADTETRSAPE
jgi:DNA invertase Pin-like site-specific DNA recombinase